MSIVKDAITAYKVSSLPKHSIKKSSLNAKGCRIQINVQDKYLSEKVCRKLIDMYLYKAKPNGQVVLYGQSLKMQRLCPNDPDRNSMFVWAVNNLDGKGTFFNYFNYGIPVNEKEKTN
jgi:hypothetical protein